VNIARVVERRRINLGLRCTAIIERLDLRTISSAPIISAAADAKLASCKVTVRMHLVRLACGV
jgi:hypothetical protein